MVQRVFMNFDEAVTVRQYAMPHNGEFQYAVNIEDITLDCLEVIGEPFMNQYYQQVSLKANTPDCRWSVTFLDAHSLAEADLIPYVAFEFIVLPLRDPPVEGELLLLNDLDLSAGYEVNLHSNDFLTVRVIETEYGFKWAAPIQEWKCVDLISSNYGDFKTGYSQWFFQAKD